MKLNQDILANLQVLQEKSYAVPLFDLGRVKENTASNPIWLHFGPGNIFRAFLCRAHQQLLDHGQAECGIIVAEGYDMEMIDKIYTPHDNLSILAQLKADGTVEKSVNAAITEALKVDRASEDFARLKEILAKESLQMISFTITEKGYSLVDSKGSYTKDVEADFQKGPEEAGSYMGKVSALLYHRFQSGQHPVSMVSMDNCSNNGMVLFRAIHTFAGVWAENGLVPKAFLDYVQDRGKVAFPSSMIDKITPRPDEQVEKLLLADGFEQISPVITEKKTYIAPFVNAEETEYLFLEDWFTNGRPPLEHGGIYFTDKATVDKVEQMKVCTCLNPLHTALAIFGCLLGYQKISDEVQDDDLLGLIKVIGYREGLPVVVDPQVIAPKDFLDTVIQKRLPNPFMPDSPQRIATDTSQKLSIRFGETIKAYARQGSGRSVNDLICIPLVLAAWLRYLMGIDDQGVPMALSSDPLLEALAPVFGGISLGGGGYKGIIQPVLSDAAIFGVDLYEAGLGEKIERYFDRLIAHKGAVRETLQAVLADIEKEAHRQ